MRKIDLLVLLPVILTKGVYASGSGNYFGGWLSDGNNNQIPTLISPAVFFGTDVLRSNPIDFVRDLNGDLVIIRIPFNPTVAGEGNNSIEKTLPRNLIMERSVVTLSYSPELDRNIVGLESNVRNDILNDNANAIQYRRRILFAINRNNPERATIDIIMRRDIERQDEDATGIATFIGCLHRYDRFDIVTTLRSEGFF